MPRQRLKTYTHSLALNGTAYVDFGKPAALQATGGYVAYFAKIYMTSYALSALHVRGRSGVNWDYQFLINADGQLGYGNNGSDFFTTVAGARITLNQWTKVAFVVGGTHTYVFVNGLLVQDLGNLAVGAYASDIKNVTGMRYGIGGQFFNGYIVDEALVMSNLTAAQVMQYSGDWNALKAVAAGAWGYQNTLNDETANAVNGTGTSTSFSTTVLPSNRATPAQTQNILVNSEHFGVGSGWGASQASITTNAAISPDGTQTADALVENNINAVHQIFQYFAGYQRAWVPFAYSAYVKAGTRNWCAFMDGNTGAAVFFDLATGAVGSYVSAGFYNAEIEPASLTIPGAASGWWRIKAMFAPISVSARRMDIAPATANLGTTYTGTAAAEAIYVWGAQAEQRNFVGQYQKTTTAVTNPVRNKNAEKQNLLAYSYDLTATPWTEDGLARVYPGAINSPDGKTRSTRFTENNAVGARHRIMYLTLPSSANKGAGYYTLSGYFHPGTRRYVALYMQDALSSQAIFDLQTGVVTSSSANTWTRITPVGGGWYRCSLTIYYNLSVGNIQIYMSNGTQIIYNGDGASYLHAWGLQYTFSNYAGKYVDTNGSALFTEELRRLNEPVQNILLYSEDFTNGAWTKQAGVVVTGNQADPFGSNKACLLDLTAAAGTTGIYQSGGVPGRVHTFSVWMRTVSGTGDILLREGGGTQVVKSLTTTWVRHELTMLLLATGPLWCIQKANANAANQVLIYGAQLTTAGWAGPYQMTSATKVDYGAIRNSSIS